MKDSKKRKYTSTTVGQRICIICHHKNKGTVSTSGPGSVNQKVDEITLPLMVLTPKMFIWVNSNLLKC